MERLIDENVIEHKYIYSIASGKIKWSCPIFNASKARALLKVLNGKISFHVYFHTYLLFDYSVRFNSKLAEFKCTWQIVLDCPLSLTILNSRWNSNCAETMRYTSIFPVVWFT